MGRLAINGGEKECGCDWPSWPIWGDEERTALTAVLESGNWWYGERVREFEERFAAFQGAKFGVTCTSGTTALETMLAAVGIGAGDEVIVPPYTFVATATAVLREGAIPIFADIQAETLCIDPEDVARKVTDKTKAVIPVHLAGYVADMDRLGEIAAEHELFILEDACHAWGSRWKGKGAGALGDCGAFSFQASKNITSGEGGIILTDDEELADRCRSHTNCGRRKGKAWYEHFAAASNLRLTEFQAALLLAQLTRLEAQTETRLSNAEVLTEALRDVPGVITIENDPRMTRRSYHLYPFRIDEGVLGVSRDRFVEALRAEGVPATCGYPVPLYRNPLFQQSGDGPDYCPVSCPYYGRKIDYSAVSCPVCERICGDTCWLPHTLLLAPLVGEEAEAIRSVVRAVRKVCENAGELR